ncbi:MAG: GAF domain-containing protein [Chloroflexi bacterium]|nr:GAF domain-containing protein [Chloroflexota bacterium]
MRRSFLFLTCLLTLLTGSCGGIATPAPVPESIVPASLPGPQPDSAPTSAFLPNPIYSQNIRFEQIGLDEGLSQSVVNVILQDRMGFLWIGTEDGLNRYDGYTFKIYKPDADDPASLSDRWITSLAEDRQGYLWIGTRLGGLNRYNPVTGTFKRYMHDNAEPDSLGNNQISALLPEKNGIWIGTGFGLDFYDFETGKFTHHRSSSEDPTSLSSNLVTAIFRDSGGTLWVGTLNAGVNAYDEETDTFEAYKYSETVSSSLSNNRVLSIAENKSGTLWIGTANGLNRFELAGRYFTRFTHSVNDPGSIAGNSIYTIYKDRSGGLWIGTNNGLDRYDETGQTFTHHQNQPGASNTISANLIRSIHEDHSSVLWIGTYGGGLNKYNRQQDKYAYYRNIPDDVNSLSSNFITAIAVDKTGMIWIGTNRGLDRLDPAVSQFTHYRYSLSREQSLINDEVLSLYIDHEGMLWVGTARGLDQFNTATGVFNHFQPDPGNPNSITNSPIYAILEDSAGILWLGAGRGLYQFNKADKSFTPYESNEDDPEGFLGDQVNVLFEDSNHNLWIGTYDEGLKRIHPQEPGIKQYKNDPDNLTSLGNDSITSIHQGRNGTLWIGTAGGGLNRYNPRTNSFTRFTEKDGLPSNVIYGILEDEFGNLWISTNFGISRFNTSSLTFRNITASDGLQSNEFNQNAFAKDQNGKLYFGGINGLNSFQPREIKDFPQPPYVALTSITQDGESLHLERTTEYLQDITLTWPQDSFEFEFTAFAYGQPTKNQYAYMLEGFDARWKTIGAQRNGRYTNLPGGTYTLKLRGSNSDGVWNDEGQSIVVTVVPPFWETWWFRAFSLLILGVAIAGGIRWRVTRVEARNRELERLVQRRTADLQKRTGEIEALYQADERILRNVTIHQVFQTLVDVSVSVLKADRSVVFTWNEDKRRIVPRVSHSFQPETLYALNYEAGEGMVGKAMQTGQSIIVPDLKLKDLRGDVQTVIRREGIQSFAHFPIVVDGKVIAVFNVAYTRPNALNEDTIRLFTALVNRASLSIANMELFEQTKDLAVMEERNRLARDLHDSAKQKAFAALAQLGTANSIMKSKSNSVTFHLAEAETLMFEVIQELTFLIQEIYPIALQEKGLPTTLKEYVFEWESRNDIEAHLAFRNERPLRLEIEQAVYRIIQESLANISRHSKAKLADISLTYNEDSLIIAIRDNGCGFETNQRAKGMGFRSMRERANSIRGSLQVQSAPGEGTCLTVQVPIKN